MSAKKEEKWVHPHALALRSRDKEYWDYENSVIDWGSVEPYELFQKIGRGKYSEVFRGRNRWNGEVCVVKVLKPVRTKKIHREISILQNLYGAPNVVRMLDIVIEPETQTPAIVFEYVENVDFRTLYPRLTDIDMRFYIYKILETLEFSHAMGIMHRDIKPHNIMIDHKLKKLRVIDWGLGEYYHHGTPYNVRVASRYYKGPELMVGYRLYDYSLDIWSLGCVLAGMIFRKDPFFVGRDNNDQLVQIVNVMGTKKFFEYLEKYEIDLPNVFNSTLLNQEKPERSWSSFITPSNASLCDPVVIDLLSKMLVYDHGLRILPVDAMKHPWFDPIRSMVAEQAEPSAATSVMPASMLPKEKPAETPEK